MKTLYVFLFFLGIIHRGFGQDLPNPAANLQEMPEGSYVIAMDNTLQANSDPTPSKRLFNLKAYGLVIYLLNNNIRVKRVIRAGKAKDAVDFSINARLVKPNVDSTAPLLNFKAGPFVVFANDAFRGNIDKLIDSYNNNAGGVSGITNAAYRIKVYKTTSPVHVDVRFDYVNWRPKISVLNDGGNAAIHSAYLVAAGVPAINYTVDYNNELATNCYTFASEPHNNNPVPAVITNITNFIRQGGSFLAECEAVENYEAVGRFHTTNGLAGTNATPTGVSYPNADLSYAQFEGPYNINLGGSLTNWKLSTGSTFINHAHAVATNTIGGVSAPPFGASAAKVTPVTELGGMVFYLGNHNFKTLTDYENINGVRLFMNAVLAPSKQASLLQYTYNMSCNTKTMQVKAEGGPANAYPITFQLYADVGSTPGAYDAGDVYLGAATITSPGEIKSFLVPPPYDSNTDFVMRISPSGSCSKMEFVQPSSCRYIALATSIKNFTAGLQDNRVRLKWQVENEADVNGYYVQRFEGGHWKNRAYLPASGFRERGGKEAVYSYYDAAGFAEPVPYRIELVNKGGQSLYSEVRQVELPGGAGPAYTVFPVPSRNGTLTIRFDADNRRAVTLFRLNGEMVRKWESFYGRQLTMEALQPGVYLVQIQEKEYVSRQKIVVL